MSLSKREPKTPHQILQFKWNIISPVVITAWKVSKRRVFSGPYFPVFGPEKTTYLDNFHAANNPVDTNQKSRVPGMIHLERPQKFLIN